MSEANGDGFTPTERRILAALSDGFPHHPDELIACLHDAEMGEWATVKVHLVSIRRKLAKRGEAIVCEINRPLATPRYRHVRLLANAHSGKH